MAQRGSSVMEQHQLGKKESLPLDKVLAIIWSELHYLHDEVSTMLEIMHQRNLDGYVGLANLPSQVYRKSVRRGFDFTLMVVGKAGLGKSTLINSLFLTELPPMDNHGAFQLVQKTMQIEQSKVVVNEDGVQLTLTIVDTPGFGDAVDNSDCWQPVINYIDNKFEDFLNSESRVNRRRMPDSRVHCCLYLISPSGHGLKPLDVEFMKRLHDKVTIIPLIAKGDTFTPEECQQVKKQIIQDIQEHKIKIYEFPDTGQHEGRKLMCKIKVEAQHCPLLMGVHHWRQVCLQVAKTKEFLSACASSDG